MMRWIVGASLQLRYLIVILAGVLMAFGISQLRSMPVDTYPEFNPPLVEVQTEALGLSADEVESLITTPMEADLLNGVAWLQRIRSESVPGLSRIELIFQPGTDVLKARQLVQERAREVKAARRGTRKGKADGESDLLAKIGEMPESDRALGERLHAIVKAAAPTLSPTTWYGTLLMVTLWLFIERTKLGRAMRAVAENHETAALLGVNVNRVVLITFIIGSGIAGIAGVLDGLKNSSVSPFMGLGAAVKGLIVMLLGGLGNVPGAMIAGLMLGTIEILSAAYIGTTERDFFSFLILILLLLYRPTGLFGTRTAEQR